MAPFTSPFSMSTIPTTLFVASKDYDPKAARMQRMFKFNVYLPPLNRLRSSDKVVKRKNVGGDIHMDNVGIVDHHSPKNVSFLADVHIFGERPRTMSGGSSSTNSSSSENFVLKSCLKQKN